MLDLERLINSQLHPTDTQPQPRLRSLCVQSQARISTLAASADHPALDFPSLYLHQNRYKSLMKLIRQTIQEPYPKLPSRPIRQLQTLPK